mmetsp:Transcript_19510/g.45386  ORF Transcript_19510/g.45386 Transcript_19510/m.45386 type:complete len:232 (-) Transcript_19510:211-906(-)|eukprot:CAMPEP_0178389486 /NCGR_PEP_ID=MMETSP0689_2-20121128/10143_1 /TAXON_ID=160604 /ORGANISM="Amphidinium massartii, Strain CS-259" /LENGTH=231 /DNA_ID=CAMNT_0020009941 /DNA_START=69 /DNA_END=764 /DNA_ORIENTATION=+
MLQEKEDDRRGGPCYNQYSRVRVETLWKQSIGKEVDTLAWQREQQGNPSFQMNLTNMSKSTGLEKLKHSHNRIELVTEKTMKQSPQARMSLKGLDPQSFEVAVVKHQELGVTEKWDVPICASHEVGWLLARPVHSETLRAPILGRRLSELRRRQAPAPAVTVVTPVNNHLLERSRSSPGVIGGHPHRDLARLTDCSSRWRRPNSNCDVTKYTETYISYLKHSPFNKEMAGR